VSSRCRQTQCEAQGHVVCPGEIGADERVDLRSPTIKETRVKTRAMSGRFRRNRGIVP